MADNFTICVGTIGSGIWRSPDGGETWTRVRPSRYPENDVRALAVHPGTRTSCTPAPTLACIGVRTAGRAGNDWTRR